MKLHAHWYPKQLRIEYRGWHLGMLFNITRWFEIFIGRLYISVQYYPIPGQRRLRFYASRMRCHGF